MALKNSSKDSQDAEVSQEPAPAPSAKPKTKVRYVNVTPYQQYNHVSGIIMYPNNPVECPEDSWIKANMAAGIIEVREE